MEKEKQLLTGETNYLGWRKVIKATLRKKKLMLSDGSFDPTMESDACDVILTSMSLNIARDIPDDEGPQAMWDWLKSRYGDDNKWDLKREFKDVKMVSIDPKAFLALVDRSMSRVETKKRG